jgi:hypothetical protein
MDNAGGTKYIIKCMSCGKEFKVPTMMSVVPQHPREGEQEKPRYTPCPGSGIAGIMIGPTS